MTTPNETRETVRMARTSDEIRSCELYPVAVCGVELHIRGTFQGCLTKFEIRMIDEAHARRWFEGIAENEKRGALNTSCQSCEIYDRRTGATIAVLR